jgi:ABC-type nitrate/sulfonate/bicarbonate transport system substrate-binding protein
MQLTVSRDWAQKNNLSPQLPLVQRFAGLRGAKIGITAPGSASDLYVRWMLRKAGLNAERDVNLIAVGAPALNPALQAGRIDAFFLSPPNGQVLEASGHGMVLVRPGDVPEFPGLVHEVLFARKDYLSRQPGIATRMARALTKANNFILTNPDEATRTLHRYFEAIPENVFREAVRAVLPLVPKDGLMTKQQWDQLAELMTEAKLVDKPVDTTEGKFWTLRYLRAK